ncbi:MAG: hypothetical protein LBJ01_00255 [Tannerella sp.]|jgi:AraC-like DNA-binding protein|nr:hypothetical protein [Tannerella sp.]
MILPPRHEGIGLAPVCHHISFGCDTSEESFAIPATERYVAVAGHFSGFYFHLIFKAMLGESPGEYIRRLRMEKAAFRLDTSCFPPKAISFKSALRLAALFFLTGEAEYSVESLRKDLEKLSERISKQIMPLRSKKRHYTRKIKKVKSQKYR